MEKKRNPATKAKAKYNANNYDQVKFVVRKGGRQLIDEAAEGLGMSRNAYILEAVAEKMKRDGVGQVLDSLGE